MKSPSRVRTILDDAFLLSSEPKRTLTEREVGLDAAFAGGAIVSELTLYDGESDGAVPLFTPAGLRAIDVAIGNQGAELVLRARLARTAALDWSASLAGSANRNRLGTASAFIGQASAGTRQFYLPGRPVDSYADVAITGFADLNGDGIISAACDTIAPCELTLGTALVPLGSPTPTRQLSLGSRLTYRGRLTAAAQLDYQGGMKLLNATRAYRCTAFGNCAEVNDPATPLAEQAKVVALTRGTFAGFVENASFVKLRELSLAWHAPERWAGALGGRSLTATVAGRNLLTFTDYDGVDPEVNEFAGMASQSASDFFTPPPVRSFLLRVEMTR
jgi:hypothetical protein